ncbi:hypothetical protein D3C76_1671540 [compost metagenome]
MPLRNFTVQQSLLNGFTELKQSNFVSDGRLAFAETLGQTFLSQLMQLNKLLISHRLFYRGETLPLQILNKGNGCSL